tara:strand:- start:747 stop:1484 length:738 start_codon:yes stop_codon:yes gene_type:complete
MHKFFFVFLLASLLDAWAAEKTIISTNGLEGFGDNGLSVSLSKIHNPNSFKVKAHAENILKKVGYKINQSSRDAIWLAAVGIELNGNVVARHGHLHCYRDMEFTLNSGKKYRTSSAARVIGSTKATPHTENEKIEEVLTLFINEWCKANPDEERDKIAGRYVARNGSEEYKATFFDDKTIKTLIDGKETNAGLWKKENNAVWVQFTDRDQFVFRVNPNHSLTLITIIGSDGARSNKEFWTYKKLK